MTTPRQFDERKIRRRADIRQGKVVSINADGSYECDDTRTGQRFRAKPWKSSDYYVPGQHVQWGSADSSMTVKGAGNVIYGSSAEESRSVARNARVSTGGLRSPVISSVLPNPVRLGIGSVIPQELKIRGYNLSEAPTYEHAEITDDSAPVIASTSVTCQLVASASAPVGFFDLTIHDRTFEDVIETYELPTQVIYLGAYESGVGPFPEMIRVDPSDMSARLVVWADDGPPVKTYAEGLNFGGNKARALWFESSNYTAYMLIGGPSNDEDEVTLVAIATGLVGNAYHNLIRKDGATVFASQSLPANPDAFKLYSVTDAGAVTEIATLSRRFESVIWDGTYFWLGRLDQTYDPTTDNIARLTEDGTTETVITGVDAQSLLYHDGYVYAADPNNDAVYQIDPATATIVDTFISAGCAFRYLAASGGYLYAAYEDSPITSTGIKKIDLSTFTEVDSLNLAGDRVAQMVISADGGTLWMASLDIANGLREIATATLTQTAEHALTINYLGSPISVQMTGSIVLAEED